MDEWRSGAVRGPKAWPDVWLLGVAFVLSFVLSVSGFVEVPGLLTRVFMILFAVRFIFRLESEMTPEDRERYQRKSKAFSVRRGVAVAVVIAAGIVMVALWPEGR